MYLRENYVDYLNNIASRDLLYISRSDQVYKVPTE